MIQNLTSLFVYWRVHPERRQLVANHFRTQWSQLPLRLRVRDVTGVWYDGYNAISSREIVVDASHDKWYVGGLEPGHDYLAEFGVLTWEAQFFALLRSNSVKMPRRPREGAYHPSIIFTTLHRAHAYPLTFDGSVSGRATPSSVSSTESYPFMTEFDGYSMVEFDGNHGT